MIGGFIRSLLLIQIPSNNDMLDALIKDISEKAIRNGNSVYTATQEYIVNDTVPFQVCLATALAKKPAGQLTAKQEQIKRMPFDPFMKPDPNLLLHDLGSHNLILNKFCIRKGHVILATKEYRSQYELLNENDFEAALKLCETTTTRHLFFYNCGPMSGASILHKHVQAIPVDGGMPFDSMIQKSDGSRLDIPFIYRFARIETTATAQMIDTKFRQLLEECLAETGHPFTGNFNTETNNDSQPDNFISYNVVFTREWILIVPRSCESFESVSVNALGFAGMLLVKTEAQLETVRTAGPMNILRHVSFPTK
jgi:sulfate adenylyltransferase (ADP) / ATP adenylyltransferase